MIVFDLCCQPAAHRFEGWFGSSDDFADQRARGLLVCPVCGSADVAKAPSAPHVGRKGNQRATGPEPVPAAMPTPAPPAPLPPEAAAALQAIARLQAEALKQSTWVGKAFADQARAMHYGERDAALIHGQATPDEASALIEEGIEIAPILFPIAPPGKAN
jgi:hypothetical protein